MDSTQIAILIERSENHDDRIESLEVNILERMNEEVELQRTTNEQLYQTNEQLHQLELAQVKGFDALNTQLSNYKWLVIGITSAVSFGITFVPFLMKVFS